MKSNIPPKPPPPSLSKGGIMKEQGCIVTALWWVSYVLTFVSFHYNLNRLARLIPDADGPYDQPHRKTTPAWQDAILCFVALLAVVSFWLAVTPLKPLRCAALPLLVIILLDLLNYHARVLWFDDLRPAIPDSSPYVWSHRRILFHAAISFAIVIVAFAGLHAFTPEFAGTSPVDLLRHSFRISATLDLNKSFGILDAVQVALSLFFLVILFATVAATAYKRRELATPPDGRKSA